MAQQGQAPLQGPQTLWQARQLVLTHRHPRTLALTLQLRQRAQAAHPNCHRENR